MTCDHSAFTESHVKSGLGKWIISTTTTTMMYFTFNWSFCVNIYNCSHGAGDKEHSFSKGKNVSLNTRHGLGWSC